MITVVGAGLAGTLLALELADRGQAVTLLDSGSAETATALSYGLMPATAARGWRRLQRRHGDLGLGRRWLQLGPRRLPVPGLQIDPQRFALLVGAALEQAGIRQRRQTLLGPSDLELLRQQGTVVLACGAGCRRLAPQIDPKLRSSWAGIVEVNDRTQAPGLCRWPGLALLPQGFSRLKLEQGAANLEQPSWIVDAALVPCGGRLLVGQITLVRPGLEAGVPPDPTEMEQRLRQGLSQRWPELARVRGRFRQAAVSFCSDGVALAGPVEPGLWVLAGFSGAFAQLPAAAAQLAATLSSEN